VVESRYRLRFAGAEHRGVAPGEKLLKVASNS